MSHFEAASKIRSGKSDPHYNLGTAFVEMNLGDALARKGQPDEAMAHFEQAIKLQPDYAEAYYNRGNVLYAKGRIDEAITDFEKTLQIQPNDADAHTGLGNALLRKGALKEAIVHYSEAMALAPQDPHCRSNLAWVLATSSDASVRDGAKAVELARQAVSLSGGREPLFFRTLAAAYAETGRFSDAIAVVQQAVAIARMQGQTGLANLLEEDVLLYRAAASASTNISWRLTHRRMQFAIQNSGAWFISLAYDTAGPSSYSEISSRSALTNWSSLGSLPLAMPVEQPS